MHTDAIFMTFQQLGRRTRLEQQLQIDWPLAFIEFINLRHPRCLVSY
jgi:hypothetical protein